MGREKGRRKKRKQYMYHHFKAFVKMDKVDHIEYIHGTKKIRHIRTSENQAVNWESLCSVHHEKELIFMCTCKEHLEVNKTI